MLASPPEASRTADATKQWPAGDGVQTALLVRSYNPTPAMVQRMSDWSAALAQSGVDFFVSMDVTHGTEAMQHVLAEIPGCRMHCYTEDEMLLHYPGLADARLCMAGEEGWAGLAPAAWHEDCHQGLVEGVAKDMWRQWTGVLWVALGCFWSLCGPNDI